MRRGLLTVAQAVLLGLCLGAPPAALAQPAIRLGMLPVDGPPGLAQRLSAELPALLKRQGVDLVGPRTLNDRLAQATVVQQVKAEASDALAQAERHELHMERGLAVADARRAVSLLRSIGARHHAPQLWVWAQFVLAQACLLKPSDPECARSALATAARADAKVRPDQLQPRIARLWNQVSQAPGRAEAPDRDELRAVVRHVDVDAVAWVALKPDGDQVEVELVVHRSAGDTYTRVAGQRMAVSGLTAGTAQTLVQLLGQGTGPRPTVRQEQRWYHKWWVWVIAGAVVTAATVGTVAAVTTSSSSPDETFTIKIRY